jgi:hypothetical protein
LSVIAATPTLQSVERGQLAVAPRTLPLMPRAQTSDLVFKFELFAFETSEPDVISRRARHLLFYSTLKKSVLLGQLSQMCVERHHSLRSR